MQPNLPVNYFNENIQKNCNKLEDLRIKTAKSEEKTPQYKKPVIQFISENDTDKSSLQKKVNTPVVKSNNKDSFPPKPATGEKLVPPPNEIYSKQPRPVSKSKFNSDNTNNGKELSRKNETNPKIPQFAENLANEKCFAGLNKGVSDDDDDEEGYIGETPGEVEHSEPLEKEKENPKQVNTKVYPPKNSPEGLRFTDSIQLSEKRNEIPQINFTQSTSVQDSVIVDKQEDDKEKCPQPKFQNPVVIPQESPIINFEKNHLLFKKENVHSINKIKICNENHIKDIISFDKKEKKAYCKNCGCIINSLQK